MTDPAPQPEPVAVVAIDGPSGAGKSTVARRLAARLGFRYLDTGAMYRAVTWLFLESQHNDLSAAAETERLLAGLALDFGPAGEVLVNGRDVTAHIRSREVESRVSGVSALPAVRQRLRLLQRQVAARGPIVAEGRDMGSVVFPGARWKFYLDAEPEERARRRFLESRDRGVDERTVLEEMAVRDRLDSTRQDAPLARSPDAEYLDTTAMAPDAVVARLLEAIRRRPLDGMEIPGS